MLRFKKHINQSNPPLLLLIRLDYNNFVVLNDILQERQEVIGPAGTKHISPGISSESMCVFFLLNKRNWHLGDTPTGAF